MGGVALTFNFADDDCDFLRERESDRDTLAISTKSK